MRIEIEETIIYWRGPAPWFFVPVPPEESSEIKAISHLATYGWGVIPVYAQIGKTRWYTALIPKEGRYLVPIKADIRKAENLAGGDLVTVQLDIEISM